MLSLLNNERIFPLCHVTCIWITVEKWAARSYGFDRSNPECMADEKRTLSFGIRNCALGVGRKRSREVWNQSKWVISCEFFFSFSSSRNKKRPFCILFVFRAVFDLKAEDAMGQIRTKRAEGTTHYRSTIGKAIPYSLLSPLIQYSIRIVRNLLKGKNWSTKKRAKDHWSGLGLLTP